MQLISGGAELTSSIIVAYQRLLKKQFAIGGLEDPAYGKEYEFSTQRGHFIQVLHVNGNHWICASNVLATPGKHCQGNSHTHYQIKFIPTLKIYLPT